jgi:short-subunit dehydrogenase
MQDHSTSNVSLNRALGWAAAGAGVFLIAHAVFKELSKFKLEGKVVLVTGASRGLGLVLARELAMRGARLAICARSAEKLEIAKQELEAIGAEVLTMPVDVNDEGFVTAAIKDVIHHYGQLDVLINNAGIIQVGPQETMEIADYEKAMQTNFWAPLYAIRAVIPHFIERGGGRIVNITSIGGKIAVPHLLPYTASKFAAVGLSEGMMAELKKHNILVTTVVPNLMRTGGPRNVDVKGNHEAEYAWFKLSDSSPLISQSAESAARDIIKALEYGETEAILSLTGKVATVIKGIAPGWVNAVMSIANSLLPDPTKDGHQTKKGYQSESKITRSKLALLTDKAAKANNEM